MSRIAVGVGTLSVATLVLSGCSTPATTSPSPVAGTSTSSAAQALVDVAAVWASHPMPPCSRVVVGGETASPGIVLPSDETVAQQLAGVRSPASESWVRTKLGWVTKHLSQTRQDIIDANNPGDKSMSKTFDLYIKHVRAELAAGQDSSDPTDAIYPEGCM
ncbi:hypothetical protein [Mycobacteroides abscessus]|uniref:hypothetical protein n=1 Tax=Mycobacteroides abscessus TaxID=36809 RepID=UPI000929744C|nr:hypothetical protein [Mycobacteroides abscessus]SIJ34407.1 Uncharacterised protein [Mycobacteroides abscessus subsp. abscessus]SIK92598.1 Uncharacterised protein [Mycobacteroides abscessus subsp. abscessus]SIL98429.1 Uncharacterised protein [Mycobacteroides abscessus subsp. abscessus]SLE80465.1 Uncharacterised protein [Mycobacteroides abscessus subsp. abscessus]